MLIPSNQLNLIQLLLQYFVMTLSGFALIQLLFNPFFCPIDRLDMNCGFTVKVIFN